MYQVSLQEEKGLAIIQSQGLLPKAYFHHIPQGKLTGGHRLLFRKDTRGWKERSSKTLLAYILLWLRLASQVALVVKNTSVNVGDIGDAGSISGLGRSLEEGHGNPLQYSNLENSKDRGAWQATVHGVIQSRT